MSLPIWIYMVVLGIIFSAFMTIKTSKAERAEEQEWIEKEGEVFLERIAKAKAQKEQIKELGQ